jgi:hypothetical protein
VNAGPTPLGADGVDLVDEYADLGVESVRTHDNDGPLDLTAIFNRTTDDPSDCSTYDWADSDETIAAIVASGATPYLRVGQSHDGDDTSIGFDASEWTEVIRNVVGRYSSLEGDCDGDYTGTVPETLYVEIWNEPNNLSFWDYTTEPVTSAIDAADEFAPFFISVFDDLDAFRGGSVAVRLGGPGLSPAGAVSAPDFGQDYVNELAARLCAAGVSLDFLSWHMYADDPSEFTHAADYYRGLDCGGAPLFSEMHLTEWSTTDGNNVPGAPAILTNTWIALHDEMDDVTYAHFYRGPGGFDGGDVFPDSLFRNADDDGDSLMDRTGLGQAFALWRDRHSHDVDLEPSLSYSSRGLTSAELRVSAGTDASGELVVLVANASAEDVDYTLEGTAVPGTTGDLTILDEDGALSSASLTSLDQTIAARSVHLLRLDAPPPPSPPPFVP